MYKYNRKAVFLVGARVAYVAAPQRCKYDVMLPVAGVLAKELFCLPEALHGMAANRADC